MAPLTAGLLGGAFTLAVVLACAAVCLCRFRPKATRRHQTPQDERTVECVTCGRTLPVSQAVVVTDVPDDAEEVELRSMGGTVCLVEYCPDHAP